MSEQFVKLHSWMTELGLNPSELIAFAVIHGYTVSCGSYKGGMEMLGKWCGVSRQHAYRYLQPLIEKGLVKQTQGSGGRNTAVYISTVKPSQYGTDEENQRGRLTVPNRDGKPSQFGTHIDNIDIIDTPYSPPTRGTAHADAKPERKRRTSGKRRRAVDIIPSGIDYSSEGLKRMGISQGEEFYDSLDELRIN